MADGLLRKNDRKQEAERLLAAERTLGAYEESGLLMKSLTKAAQGDAQCTRAARTMLLGNLQADYGSNELLSIVGHALEYGSSARHALRMLVSRLEHARDITDSIRAKIGSMQMLTYIGMAFFFPLFSSISATIMSGAVGAVSAQAYSASGKLVVMALAYACTILLLSSSFAHPERSASKNIISILPYFAVAVATSVGAGALLSNIL